MSGGGVGEVYVWRWGKEKCMYGGGIGEGYVWRWDRRSVCMEVG